MSFLRRLATAVTAALGLLPALLLGTLLGAVLGSQAVQADEAWYTDDNVQVIYETDIGTTAVFRYILPSGVEGRLFLEGLAGVTQGRGNYWGYWTEQGRGGRRCAADLVNAQGQTASTWGRAELIFVDPTFPGQWILRWGECFNLPTRVRVGRPSVG